MGNGQVNAREFIVKAGMTPDDVRSALKATPQQKALAAVFDSDGISGYSQREADVFNATLIADHGKQGVSLWTQYADGSRKETAVKGDIASFKYAPQGDVKTYVKTKSALSNPQSKLNKSNSLANKAVEEFEKTGKGHLSVETYQNGSIKTKKFISEDGSIRTKQEYYEDGTLKLEQYEKNGLRLEDIKYYANGKIDTKITKETYNTITKEQYYEDGTPKLKQVEINGLRVEDTKYYTNGKIDTKIIKKSYNTITKEQYYENGTPKLKQVEINSLRVEDTTYYPNGKKQKETIKERSPRKDITNTYYENGQLKQHRIDKEKGDIWIMSTCVNYDEKGNVINADMSQ